MMFIEGSFTLSLSAHVISCRTYTYCSFYETHVRISFFFLLLFSVGVKAMQVCACIV